MFEGARPILACFRGSGVRVFFATYHGMEVQRRLLVGLVGICVHVRVPGELTGFVQGGGGSHRVGFPSAKGRTTGEVE